MSGCRPLDGLDPADPTLGGKAAGLARLIALGVRVPPGFILRSADGDALPPDLIQHAAALGPRLAVRSSAMGEDGEDASFAGQYETILDVAPPDVPDAVRACLASASSVRAQAYRDRVGQGGTPPMTVVVQRMVNASAAGVVFTVDPVSGRRDRVIVDAVAGLGEALVSGHATPDHSACAPDGTIWHQELSGASPVLSAEQVRALVRGACRLSADVGQPLDLEWAIDGAGQLWWLQARPVTALPRDPTELDVRSPRAGDIYTRCNVGEMMPGAVSPLTLSVTGRSIEVGMQRMYITFGAMPAETDDWLFVGCAQGQMLLNLSGIAEKTAPILGASARAAALAICGQPVDVLQEPPPTGILRRVRNTARYVRALTSAPRVIRDLRALTERLRIDGDTPEALYQSLDTHQPAIREAYALHLISSAGSGALASALASILSAGKDPAAEHHAQVAAALSGAADVESADVVACIEAVCAALRRRPDRDAIVSSSDDDLLSDLSGDPSWQHLMATHGHRGYRELSMRSPSWRADPVPLLRAVRTALRAPPPSPPPAHALPVALDRWPQRAMVRWAHTAIRNREITKSLLVRVSLAFKEGYRRLGTMLAAGGRLPDADAVCFLTHEELGQLIQGSDLAAVAVARREGLARQDRLSMPDVSVGLPEPLRARVTDGDSVLGKPVSRGCVRGTARVVRSLDEAAAIQPGDILIAPITDVGWTPYFSIIAGLVTDLGSAVSHGAVVAREIGLPAVVNTRTGTALFRSGDHVEVDGDTGLVRRISSDGEA